MQKPDNETALPQRRVTAGKIIKIIVWLLPSVVAAGMAVFFYLQWQRAQQAANLAGDGQTEAAMRAEQKEIQSIEKQLGGVILLPQGETPTLITVKDKDEIRENKEFFADAQNGDKVLVYQQARKAFLFRPGSKKLINLAPINISPGSDSQEADQATGSSEISESPALTTLPEAQKPVTIELRNGTEAQGLTFQFEPKLAASSLKTEVIERDNASRDDYEKSVVVTVNLTKKALAQRVANELGLVIAELPAGESKSESDILILLGADQL